MKTIDHAFELRGIFGAFEMAEHETNGPNQSRGTNRSRRLTLNRTSDLLSGSQRSLPRLNQTTQVLSDQMGVVHRCPEIRMTHRLLDLYGVPAVRQPGGHPPVSQVVLVEIGREFGPVHRSFECPP
jgi:hypothetical protein